MKKLLLSAVLLFGATTGANAQMADGDIAPNFTFTDVGGTTHTLYDYLDQGKTVVLDLFAVWCSPCWSYAQSGVLDQVHSMYGPTGTNEMEVFTVEADPSTAASEITGGGSSIGDWTTVVSNPMGDHTSIAGLYELAYYPTIYVICPNRQITEAGQLSTASAFYSYVGTCPVANGTTNGALLNYTGEDVTCGSPVAMSVDLQNMGSSALTAATIEVFDGATSVLSYNWTGNLATYAMENVNIGTVSPANTTTYTIQITSTDDNASDNTLTQTINTAQETNISITVEVLTDDYADESYFEITNSTGTVIWSEGNENVAGNFDTGSFPAPADGTNPLANNTAYSWPVNLPAVDCYTFTAYDYYGDGLGASQWGGTDGSWDIKDNTGAIILSESAADFGGSDEGLVKNMSVGLGELAIEGVKVFPNPANEVLNVTFDANNTDYTVELTDLQGRTVATQSFNGVTGAQTVNFSVADVAAGSYIVTISNDAVSHTENVVIK